MTSAHLIVGNFYPALLSVMLAMTLSFAIIRLTAEPQPAADYSLASAGETPVICMDDETRDKVRGVMLDGLDNALRSHVERLFTVWMKVVDDPDQPARIRTGVQQAVHAWQKAREGVLKWHPMRCATN